MNYDDWKSTNPADEELGEPPCARCFADGFSECRCEPEEEPLPVLPSLADLTAALSAPEPAGEPFPAAAVEHMAIGMWCGFYANSGARVEDALRWWTQHHDDGKERWRGRARFLMALLKETA